MSGSKQLKPDAIGSIIALHKCGYSIRDIAKKLTVPKSTVNFWILRHKNQGAGSTPAPKCRSGRPRKTTFHTDKVIKRTVLKNPSISAKEIKYEHINVLQDVSERTIQRRLQKDLKLPSRHAARKPLLTAVMRKKRIAFCKKYINLTAVDWAKVLFSDESSFLTFRSRAKTVRRPIGSNRFDPKYTIKTMKHPASIMVWGCFSYFGLGGLYFLPKNTTMNGERYLNMLKEKLQMSMHILRTTTFQQDGAPCHRGKIVKEWFNVNKIKLLEWPGNSPDLNPIENLWLIIKNKLKDYDTGSLPKLEKAIKTIWCTKLSRELCQNLVNSMPKRLKQVIRNKGEMTKY